MDEKGLKNRMEAQNTNTKPKARLLPRSPAPQSNHAPRGPHHARSEAGQMYSKTVQQVSLHLKTGEANQTHRLGINALAFDGTNSWLYSAGRDSSVHCWDLSQGPQVSLSPSLRLPPRGFAASVRENLTLSSKTPQTESSSSGHLLSPQPLDQRSRPLL